MNKLTKIAAASVVALGLGLGMAGQAQATLFSYAYSHLDVKDFVITGTGSLANTATTSSDGSTKTGFVSEINAHPTDALQAYSGFPARPAENTFGQLGHVGDYARGDAVIWNRDVITGGRAENVAELFLSGNRELGTGNGLNELTGEFTLAADGTVGVSFNSLHYLEAQLGTENVAPSIAQAHIQFLFKIYDDAGTVYVNWDGDDLSDSVSAHPGDPLQSLGDNTSYHFHSNSWGLLAGDYNMDIRMVENVSGTSVPEPGSIFLLGVGLMGLVYGRRKMAHSV